MQSTASVPPYRRLYKAPYVSRRARSLRNYRAAGTVRTATACRRGINIVLLFVVTILATSSREPASNPRMVLPHGEVTSSSSELGRTPAQPRAKSLVRVNLKTSAPRDQLTFVFLGAPLSFFRLQLLCDMGSTRNAGAGAQSGSELGSGFMVSDGLLEQRGRSRLMHPLGEERNTQKTGICRHSLN